MVGYSKASLRDRRSLDRGEAFGVVYFNWGSIRKAAVRADRIVFLAEDLDAALGVEQIQEPLPIQAIVAEAAMEAFHIGVLPRASRLYVHARYTGFP